MVPDTPNPDNPIDHALTLAGLGLRVVPIAPGRKHPALPAWNTAATNDPDTVNNWWTGLYRHHGVGIAMGPQPSGHNLFALDIDGKAGMIAFQALVTNHGKLPATWASDTGSGTGHHLILAAPPDATIRNQQAAGRRVADHVDVRGDGGQIVVAPTTHPTGGTYQWRPDRAPWQLPVAAAPGWLLELVVEPVGTRCPHCGSSNVKEVQ